MADVLAEHSGDTVPAGRSDRGEAMRHTQDVFRSSSEREEQLIKEATQRSIRLAPYRPLISEGEVGSELFYIERGWAYCFRTGAGGCRQILDFIMPGEIVGLQAALLGVTDHSVHSLTSLRATVLDRRLVGEAFRTAPELALRFARHLATEARRAGELLTVLGCGDAVERMAFLMIMLYQRQAEREPEISPLACPFPLRRRHMADALGMTGAHIHRTLNRLREDGVALVEDHRLVIRDLPRLAALAGVASSDAPPA